MAADIVDIHDVEVFKLSHRSAENKERLIAYHCSY